MGEKNYRIFIFYVLFNFLLKTFLFHKEVQYTWIGL